ncbi:MAG: epsE [Rhizobacter sp.]|nr:epsE [Rhizobacter sp.]
MKYLVRFILQSLVLAFAFTSGAFAQPAAAAQPTMINSDHALGVGDVIKIAVYQNADLSLETRISEAGEISFPLIGVVKLGGLTLPAAENLIAKRLRDGKFVLQPQVNITLLQIRSSQMSILGQVSKPGRYPIEAANSKVSEMIAVAGGVVPGASDVVTLSGTRNGQPIKVDIDLPQIIQSGKTELDMIVQNNDIIFVDRAPMLYIYGEVQRPGSFRVERGMTLMQALASAGGLSARGTERGIRINRKDAAGNVTVVQPKITDLVERDDVIYVRESLF